jgi:Zn ribbon nucleic-acid-binding protein
MPNSLEQMRNSAPVQWSPKYKCPACRSHAAIDTVRHIGSVTIRHHKCVNVQCGYRCKTTEEQS